MSATHPQTKPGARVVLVTGAAGHLGRAVAAAFAAAGDRLALLDLDAAALAAAHGAESDLMRLLPADLRVQSEVDAAVQATLRHHGRIDVLCNLAGGFRMGSPVHETPDGDWDFLFELNVRSLLRTAHAVVPAMLARGSGAIVNVGAASASKGLAQMGAYTASKSVVARLTEAMSAELRDRGIRVNAVLPSILDTPPNRAAMPEADPSRWVTPEALAEVIVFLASPAARAVHGACVPVVGLS